MFYMHIPSVTSDESGTSRESYMTALVPDITTRLECLGYEVAIDLVEMDRIVPNETPMSVVYELVDKAVFNQFPGLAGCDRLALNERYNRLLVRLVGKRAFRFIETDWDVISEMVEKRALRASFLSTPMGE